MRRFFGLALLALAGCLQSPPLPTGDDPEREKDLDVRTIGDVTEVGNVSPLQVSGVGLVRGLQGTGGAPPGSYRADLERQLRMNGDEKVKALLDDPDNALVRVTGYIPAGARRADTFDLKVDFPPGSRAISLAGGFLQVCLLRNYEQSKNISPERANQLLQGHVLARGKGPLLVGLHSADEPADLRHADIWQGGVSVIDRPLFFEMKQDNRSPRIASAVADRLNFMFAEDNRKVRVFEAHKKALLQQDEVLQQLNQQQTAVGRGLVAHARKEMVVDVAIPYTYRFNVQRYIRVARLMPLREPGGEASMRYRRRLQKMLLDPADTMRAALRLEALGKESIGALKEGLNSEQTMVRFASAESLTYLGSTAGVEELAKLARQDPMVTNYALVALAGLDEPICRTKLADLLSCDDTSVRCAAFMALRLAAEHDPPDPDGRPNRWLNGRLLGETFWLHQVAPEAAPLVTYAVERRAEIVLYGSKITLVPGTRVLVGDLVVVVEPGDDRCTVSHISARTGARCKQCSLALVEVLQSLAELGGGYPDAVELLRKLEERQQLSCPVRVTTLPPDTTLETLVEAGRTQADSKR